MLILELSLKVNILSSKSIEVLNLRQQVKMLDPLQFNFYNLNNVQHIPEYFQNTVKSI